MLNISYAIKSLLTKGYFVNDREVSERPIMKDIVYKQN